MIDSHGGGMVTSAAMPRVPIGNTYTGGTTVLSGTLEVVNALALPSTGVLTVAGPKSIVSSIRTGTLFGNNATEQAVVVASPGVDIAYASPGTDASNSPIPALATGVSTAPVGSSPAQSPSLAR